MSLQALITRGCKTDHGGIILDATNTFVIDGIGVHLEGMTHYCPKCKILAWDMARYIHVVRLCYVAKYFEDKEVAKLYVEELNNILKHKSKNIYEFCKTLNEKLGEDDIEENELYSTIDQLLEDDNLGNLDKKIISKKNLQKRH